MTLVAAAFWSVWGVFFLFEAARKKEARFGRVVSAAIVLYTAYLLVG